MRADIVDGLRFVGQHVWLWGTWPPELLGRVRSVDWLLSTGLVPVSFAITRPIAGWVGVENVMLGAGIAASILTVAFFLLPGMRDTETPGHTRRVILSELPPQEAATPASSGFADARPPVT